MPLPWKENEPALPALSEALKSKREDVEFAVVPAAFATGSSARASPPQPTSAEVQAARQRKERTRRRAIRDSNRPLGRERLSLERGELGAPILRVLSQCGRFAAGYRLSQPFRRLPQRRDGTCHHVLAL